MFLDEATLGRNKVWAGQALAALREAQAPGGRVLRSSPGAQSLNRRLRPESHRAGRTIWIVDAHSCGKGFVVRADEMLTPFVELERAIHEFAVSLSF